MNTCLLYTSRARTLFTQLGVADLADSYPRELSGGEMRRVSIARALMNQPSLLIADEPTGDLDQELSLIHICILNVPKRGLGDRAEGVLLAYAREHGTSFFYALMHLDEIEVPTRTATSLRAFRDLMGALSQFTRAHDSKPSEIVAEVLDVYKRQAVAMATVAA